MAPEPSPVLTLAPTAATSTIRSTASPPVSAMAKNTSPSATRSPPASTTVKSPQEQQLSVPSHATASEDHRMSSPPPKLPEIAPSPPAPMAPSPPSKTLSPKSSIVAPSQTQAPAQLALLLSNALSDADALRRELAEEKKRNAKNERILANLQANTGSPSGAKRNELPENAVKAILEAEARTERAERIRDDALHALSVLSNYFVELDRYETACSMRIADARNAFSRLLSTITPTLQASPSPSNASPSFSFTLPSIPAPLPQSASIAGVSLPPITSAHARYSRAVPPQQQQQQPQASFSGSYTPQSAYPPNGIPASSSTNNHVRQNSSSASFSGLPLPPPPQAAGLGATATIMSHPTVPAKRVHRSRSTRTEEDVAWDDPKRRRVGSWGMDVDETVVPLSAIPHESSSYSQVTQHQQVSQPLSSQSSQIQPRIYERERGAQTPSYTYPPMASASMSNRSRGGEPEREREPINGLGRVDARELVRDAKERERRGRSYVRPATTSNHGYSVDPQMQGQQQIHNRPSESRRRRRSASRSSAGSSWSIDEMLLETATDRERERERERGRPSPPGVVGPHREPPVMGQYQTHVFTPPVTAGLPATSSSASLSGVQANNVDVTYTGPQSAGSGTGSKRTASSTNGVNGLGYNGVGASVNGVPVNGSNANGNSMLTGNTSMAGNGLTPAAGGGGKQGSGAVPATQLVTLGPGGVVVSGGGNTSAAANAIPGGGFPAQNTAGQRICRQCGVPGRYKDGKCVEKWGPGPEGPGTVCDRCRKKMKRVERRGTLDSAAASAQLLPHRQNQLQPAASFPPLHHSHSRPRMLGRTDTIVIDHHQQEHGQSQSQGYSQLTQSQSQIITPSPRSSQVQVYSRERDNRSSRSHSPIGPGASYGNPSGATNPLTSSSRHSIHSQSHYSHNGQSQGSSQRRPPTPPYINSISTRDQYDELEGDRDELEDDHEHRRRVRETDGDGEDLDIDAELERAAAGSPPGQSRRGIPSSVYGNNSTNGSKKYLNPGYGEGKPRISPNGTVYPPLSSNTHHYKARATGSTGKRTPVNGSTTSKYPHSHARRRDDIQHDELADDHDLEADDDVPMSAAAHHVAKLARAHAHQGHLGHSSVQSHGHGGADYDIDADADADGSGSGDADADADPDAEIMDAVDAAMKVED